MREPSSRFLQSSGREVTAVIEQGKERTVRIEADYADAGRAHSEPAELRRRNADCGTKNRGNCEVVAYHRDRAVVVLFDLIQNCGPGTVLKLVAGFAAAVFKKGSSRMSVGDFRAFLRTGSMHVRTFSRKYSSSRNPYARRWMTRILLFSPSTNPSDTLFSGLQ